MSDSKIFTAVNSLIKTNRMHKKLLDSRLSEAIGLHRTQHIILMHLCGKERIPSQKELAEHLNITPAAVTGALKTLETEGYISRNIGSDSRYNEITITDLGRRIVEESRAVFSKVDKALFEDFSSEEIEFLISCLEKMQNNMAKQEEVK